MTTLVLADVTGAILGDVTAKAISAAKAIGAPIHVLVAGQGIYDTAKAAAAFDGVEKVLVADDAAYAHAMAEPLAALLVALAPSYDTILAASTAASKNVMPRVAALLDVMQLSDITKVVSADTFERPIYAGNAIQTVQSKEAKKVVTVQTASFDAAATGAAAAPVETVGPGVSDPGVSAFKSDELAKSDRPELTGAKIVVSGGRAVGTAENFQTLIVPLADALHAAVGASRAAVDAGYAPNDWQVGQTGKIVAPALYIAVGISGAMDAAGSPPRATVDAGYAPNDWQVGQTGKIVAPALYIAVGISGAIQHLAGMKDSKIIVAINKDEEAPIFQVADYGLVGDLFTIVPELTQLLANQALAKKGG